MVKDSFPLILQCIDISDNFSWLLSHVYVVELFTPLANFSGGKATFKVKTLDKITEL